MLTYFQLRDASKCDSKECDNCNCNSFGSCCTEESANTALALMEENEHLKFISGEKNSALKEIFVYCVNRFKEEEMDKEMLEALQRCEENID